MPFLSDPHHQTIFSAMYSFASEPRSQQKLIVLEDGDRLSLEITTPKEWRPTDPTVLLIHGLCGSHRSSYVVRLAKRLESLGIRAVRFNMRGCGSGKGLAKKFYHSGRSEDVFFALRELKRDHPQSPIVVVGFSLGGNITLKLAGELGQNGAELLHGAIAISPPIDLQRSVRLLGEPENELYERYFYKMMRTEVLERHALFKDLPPVKLPKNLKIYEFDQLYVAPSFGFRDALDYYERCSAIRVIEEIHVPCKLLLAIDDPIVSHESIHQCAVPRNVSVYKTQKGGHLGYISRPSKSRGCFWLDGQVEKWLLEMFEKQT